MVMYMSSYNVARVHVHLLMAVYNTLPRAVVVPVPSFSSPVRLISATQFDYCMLHRPVQQVHHEFFMWAKGTFFLIKYRVSTHPNLVSRLFDALIKPQNLATNAL